MASLSQKMFVGILANPNTATVEMQHQAYDFAVRTNNEDILVCLARVKSLDPEIETALSKRDGLRVLEAWASRPGRTQDEIVARFSKEKRATLLLGLAQTENLPEALYFTFASRKSVGVNWALLDNPSTPVALKKELAVTLATSMKQETGAIRDPLKLVSKAEDAVFVAFAENLRNSYAVRLLSESLDAESSADRVQALISAAQETNAVGRGYDALSMLDVLLRSKIADELLPLVEDAAVKTIALNPDVRHYDIGNSVERSIARRTTDVGLLLDAIRDAGSETRLIDAEKTYVETMQKLRIAVDRETLGRLILGNRHCGEQQLSQHYRFLTSSVARSIADRAIDAGDVGLARRVCSFGHVYGIDVFSAVYEASANRDEFVAWMIGEDAVSPDYITGSRAVCSDTAAAIRLLPAATTLQSTAYAGLIAEILAEKLGSSPEKWHMFTTLADEWRGSFVALVDTAVSLTDG